MNAANVIPFPLSRARAWSDADERAFATLRAVGLSDQRAAGVVERVRHAEPDTRAGMLAFATREALRDAKPKRGHNPKSRPQPIPANVALFPNVSRTGWTGHDEYMFDYHREQGYDERKAAIIVNEERAYKVDLPGESYDEGLRRKAGASLRLLWRMQKGDLQP